MQEDIIPDYDSSSGGGEEEEEAVVTTNPTVPVPEEKDAPTPVIKQPSYEELFLAMSPNEQRTELIRIAEENRNLRYTYLVKERDLLKRKNELIQEQHDACDREIEEIRKRRRSPSRSRSISPKKRREKYGSSSSSSSRSRSSRSRSRSRSSRSRSSRSQSSERSDRSKSPAHKSGRSTSPKKTTEEQRVTFTGIKNFGGGGGDEDYPKHNAIHIDMSKASPDVVEPIYNNNSNRRKSPPRRRSISPPMRNHGNGGGGFGDNDYGRNNFGNNNSRGRYDWSMIPPQQPLYNNQFNNNNNNYQDDRQPPRNYDGPNYRPLPDRKRIKYSGKSRRNGRR